MKIKILLFAILFSCISVFTANEANAVYSIEIQEAYYWALSKSITNLAPVDAADLDWVVTRQAMAKVISNFAINVLGKSPDTSKECNFIDNDIAEGLLPHVITSCQLWLMGQWINTFDPYSVVTRAEFWTILSRVLWWDKYDKWKRHTFYEKHLKALNEAWIMKDTDPAKIELRGYVFIMLMRTANMLKEEKAKLEAEKAAKNATWSIENLSWGVQTGAVATWSVLSWNILTWGALTGSVSTWGVSTWEASTWVVYGRSNKKVFTINTWWAFPTSWDTAKAETKTPTTDDSSTVKEEEKAEPVEYTFKVQETIVYNTDWDKIYWKLYKPDRAWKMPLIIFSHGLWSNYESWIPYAEAIAKYGVAVYLFDFRGWWPKSLSDWESTQMSLLTEKYDLETVFGQAKKWSFVDANNIILWWASQGWAVSALVASSHSDVKWSILFFPAFNIPETVRKMYSDPDDIPDSYGFTSMMVWKRYATDVWDLKIYDEIKKDEKPVLIVHWTSDPIVNISYSEKASQTYKNCTFKKIQGWYHWFSGAGFNESVKYVVEFLEKLWII